MNKQSKADVYVSSFFGQNTSSNHMREKRIFLKSLTHPTTQKGKHDCIMSAFELNLNSVDFVSRGTFDINTPNCVQSRVRLDLIDNVNELRHNI